MKHQWAWAVVGLGLALPAWVGAEPMGTPPADGGSELLLFAEVVSATKFVQKANEAPDIVTVISRKQIRDYGWISLNDILYKQPGFFPAQDYDRMTVGSRGLWEGWNNNHLLLLVDGVPFNDNLYGSAYTSEITPLLMAKSVEIIRGPGSTLYGSNATNGVVSINTLSAKDVKTGGEAEFLIGNFGTQMMNYLGAVDDETVSLMMGYNRFSSGGNEYDDADGSGRLDSQGRPAQFRVGDSRGSEYFFSKLQGEQGAWKAWSLQAHWQDWNFETGHGWLWVTPDFFESMKENRLLLTLAYKPVSEDSFTQEYVLAYQRHAIDWNVRFLENGAFGGFYPSGVWEYLNTQASDVFGRAQWAYILPEQAKLLGGLESSVFYYSGDTAHFSNVDLDNAAGGFPPFADGRMQNLGPWLAWVDQKPVWNLGAFAQASSGRWLGPVEATAGVRYDNQSFEFNALDKPDVPKEKMTFSQVSPRLGLVAVLSNEFSLKGSAARAFRAPSPTESFAAHTWTLASNLRELKPEIITTYSLGSNWSLAKNWAWSADVYWTKFENEIAYSVANNNLSTNVYTLTTAGIETELICKLEKVSGFVNYAYARRLDESILDATIAASPGELTWAPAHTANLGAVYAEGPLSASLQGHYQGAVKRRESDNANPAAAAERMAGVPAWFSLDAKVEYAITPNLVLGLRGTNLLGSANYLAKNFSYPFDYRMAGRSVLADLTLRLGGFARPL